MDSPGYLEQAGVSEADWEQTPVSVKRLVEELLERIAYQDQQIQKMQSDIDWLKEKLERDSSNSSLPPSTDQGKRSYPQRKRSGKQRGGQAGHQRHTRELYAIEDCSRVEDYYPEQCWQCGKPLHQEEGQVHRHQIVEIPVIVPEVSEYRLHQCVCCECNVLTRASLPEGVSAKGYGPRVVATVGILSALHHQSQRLVQAGMLNLFGIKVSLGGINNMRHESSQSVSESVLSSPSLSSPSSYIWCAHSG